MTMYRTRAAQETEALIDVLRGEPGRLPLRPGILKQRTGIDKRRVPVLLREVPDRVRMSRDRRGVLFAYLG